MGKVAYTTAQGCTLRDKRQEADLRTISFTEFRQSASAVLDLVERGERVRLIRHGRPVATIVPAEADEGTPSWRRPGLRLVASGASLSAAVIEERRRGR